MKEVKYSSVGSSSTSSVESVAGTVVTRCWNPKLPAHFNAGFVTVAVVSLMVVLQIRDTVKSGFFYDIKRLIHPLDPPEEVDIPQHWNCSSHEFLPIISDWDEQRLRWIEGDPNFKVPEIARPRVLMVSGSSQDEGELYILSHLLLRAGKNKQDYTQMHNLELYYNMVNPDPEFSDWWVKLPVIRMLMLRHPEVEWIWWLDPDAVITDMTFEPPFATLDRYNLVLYGEDGLAHDSLDPTSLSTGVFMIRNCQWSLDLLGAWAYTGTDSKREEAGDAKFQSEDMDANRTVDVVPGDDRSSLVALLAQDKRNPTGHQKWVPKVKLVEETEYVKTGNWTVVEPKLEELSMEKDLVVPFIIHFDGCLPHPSEVPELSRQDSENFSACVEQLERAFDFAENQVYKELGLERNTIGDVSEAYTWKDAPKEESTEKVFGILPKVTDWDEKRKAYMESKPWIKKNLAVLLSGSQPRPCTKKEGSHLLVRGLKNKIDYSRVHGIRIFYNMAVIHKNLTGWWSKLPALKLMMINSLDVEWIWWTDSDAVFTSMDFELPFERYNADGYNLILWGDEHEVFDLKKYNGINTGSMFIRNCQWSLDLLDRWAPLANLTGDFLSNFLDRPQSWPADDQSTLVYLLITEREKWAPKVYYENDIVLSGEWKYWTSLFVDEYKMQADKRPLMTHFAGCHPCKEEIGFDSCLRMYDRSYNFADNQVLVNYGLRHERLNSSRIIGDFQGGAQEWNDHEIERMVSKSPEELPASKELDLTKEEKVELTKEQNEVFSTKEEEQEATIQEEVAAKEEEKQVATEEQKVDQTKEDGVGPPEQEKVNRPGEESELSKESTDRMEVPEEEEPTYEEVMNETQEEEVEKIREDGLSQSQEEQNNSEEEITQTEEQREAPKEELSSLANEESATIMGEKSKDP